MLYQMQRDCIEDSSRHCNYALTILSLACLLTGAHDVFRYLVHSDFSTLALPISGPE